MTQDIYEVVKAPNAVLKENASPIESITVDIERQGEMMINTMYADAGIGLAANQVGILNRMFVMDLPENSWFYDGEDNQGVKLIQAGYKSGQREAELIKNPLVFINPEIVWQSDQKSVYEEGCLSLPKQYADVVRPCAIKVQYQTIEGTTEIKEYEGLHAHCVQHEIDHLNGILFIDYLSSLKRNMILRRMKKYTKEHSNKTEVL